MPIRGRLVNIPHVNTPEPSVIPPLPAPESVRPEPVLRLLISAALLTLVGDFLLWAATPGLSWGLFLAAISAAILLNRPRSAWSRSSAILLGLLLATAAQSAIELSFTNVVTGLALTVGLLGETSYPGLRSGWERSSEALWAACKAPGRWSWAIEAFAKLAWTNTGIVGVLFRMVRIGLPALVLAVIFAALLGAGNAIFGAWMSESFAALWRWIVALELSFGHILFYGLLATVSLVVLRPSGAAKKPRFWARTIPRLPVLNPSIAWWRSVVVLVVLNGLFFVVNTIDVFYLWTHAQLLPTRVSYSQFVHEGVNSLIGAALLSAVVIAVIFQQAAGVSESRALKRLGYVWIAQNGVLIAGVMLRLYRYIEAYLLTPQRVYALGFVLLVAAGFALLAVHIARNKTANWLILSNALATLGLFFAMQFLNVAGWVANYNVTHWEREPKRGLEPGLFQHLGSPAWSAAERVAASDRPEARWAKDWLKTARAKEREALKTANWRSWQGRHAADAARLLRESSH